MSVENKFCETILEMSHDSRNYVGRLVEKTYRITTVMSGKESLSFYNQKSPPQTTLFLFEARFPHGALADLDLIM